MNRIKRCGLGVSIAALLIGGAAAAAGSVGTITLGGWAGVTPGMTPLQMQRVLGAPIVQASAKRGSHCRMARIAIGPVRGYALFQDGRLGGIFFSSGVKTDRGIGVGSTRRALIKAYGASRLIFWPAPSNRHRFDVYTKQRYRGDARALRFDLDLRTDRVTQLGLGGLRTLSITSGRC